VAGRTGFLYLADRLLIATMLPRMALALAFVLVALVIERLLRLFDFAMGHGAAFGPVLAMAVNLLPHYLGLALPVAFCLGVLGALGKLSENNEIDALEGAGWSLRRIGLPFVACAAVLSIFSLGLFGYVQPYARYAYYAERNDLISAGWRGRVEAQIFLEIGDGMALSAKSIGADGRTLEQIVLLRETAGGHIATTAEHGVIAPEPTGDRRTLILEGTRSLLPDGSTARVDRIRIEHEVHPGGAFRPRGGNARELTLSELWARLAAPGAAEPRHAVEFHDRLVRAVSLFGVAWLAVPLGVARKRAPLWPRIAIAVVTLALYDNAVKFAGGIGTLGQVPPAATLWALALAFNGAALAFYLATPGQGTASPLRRLRLRRRFGRPGGLPPRPALRADRVRP